MAELTVHDVNHDGVDPSAQSTGAASGGDTVPNNGRTFIWVENTDTSSKDVTVDNKTLSNYGKDDDVVTTIPAGEDRLLGPFPSSRFGDPISLSYSDVTGLNVTALRLTPEGIEGTEDTV